MYVCQFRFLQTSLNPLSKMFMYRVCVKTEFSRDMVIWLFNSEISVLISDLVSSISQAVLETEGVQDNEDVWVEGESLPFFCMHIKNTLWISCGVIIGALQTLVPNQKQKTGILAFVHFKQSRASMCNRCSGKQCMWALRTDSFQMRDVSLLSSSVVSEFAVSLMVKAGRRVGFGGVGCCPISGAS